MTAEISARGCCSNLSCSDYSDFLAGGASPASSFFSVHSATFTAKRFPSRFHQRDVAAAVGFAFVGTDRFAAAAEPFAFILAAAAVFFGGGTVALATAGVFTALALAFAFVEAAAEVDFSALATGVSATGPLLDLAKPEGPGRETAESDGGEFVEIAAIEAGVGHQWLRMSVGVPHYIRWTGC